MTTITLNDLTESTELDSQAIAAVTGGFLGGLVPFSKPSGAFFPTINNLFINYNYEQTINQMNPTNISIFNGDTGGDVNTIIDTNAVIAASPMSSTQLRGLPG